MNFSIWKIVEVESKSICKTIFSMIYKYMYTNEILSKKKNDGNWLYLNDI